MSALNMLAPIEGTLGKYDQAEKRFQEAMDLRGRVLGKTHAKTIGTMTQLGDLLVKQEKFYEAAQLGGILLERQKYAETEPLLLAGYKALKKDETKKSPIQFKESIQRLVKLFKGWHAPDPNRGYDTKAVDWQAKLDEYIAGAQFQKTENQEETGPISENDR